VITIPETTKESENDERLRLVNALYLARGQDNKRIRFCMIRLGAFILHFSQT